jgi:hypothetical protein
MAKSSLRQIVPSTRGLEVGSKPLDPNRENSRSLTSTSPAPPQIVPSAQERLGVGSMVMITMALRSRCRQPKKLSLQDLYPPRRRGTGLRQKDDGDGSMVMITTALTSTCRQPEKYRCRTYTPYTPQRRQET